MWVCMWVGGWVGWGVKRGGVGVEDGWGEEVGVGVSGYGWLECGLGWWVCVYMWVGGLGCGVGRWVGAGVYVWMG